MSEHCRGERLLEPSTRLPAGVVVAERYEVLGFLGAGGGFMPTYRALDRETATHVALKLPVIHPEICVLREQYLEEAQRLAVFEHEHVAKLLDFGLWGVAQQPYVVMELCEGEDFRVFLQGEALAPSRAVRLVRQALEGLSSLHAAGLAHQTLRPSQLRCLRAGQPDEQVKIVGFDLMFDLSVHRHGAFLNGYPFDFLSDGGELLGLYMDPACTGQFFSKSVRGILYHSSSDVFSMGMVLADLVCRSQARSEVEYLEYITGILSGRVQLADSLWSSELGPVLQGALTMTREARFPDAGAFLEALAAVDVASLDGLDLAPPRRLSPVVEEKAGVMSRAGEAWSGWVERSVFGVRLGALLGATLVVALIILVFVVAFGCTGR